VRPENGDARPGCRDVGDVAAEQVILFVAAKLEIVALELERFHSLDGRLHLVGLGPELPVAPSFSFPLALYPCGGEETLEIVRCEAVDLCERRHLRIPCGQGSFDLLDVSRNVPMLDVTESTSVQSRRWT